MFVFNRTHFACPSCGTEGQEWHKKPKVWVCPSCCSFFSEFGLVFEPESEKEDFWS